MTKCTVQNCQYELLEEERKKLEDKNIKWIDQVQRFDCNTDISYPTPSIQHLQDKNINIDEALQSGDLDFLHVSKKYTPSIDQPGCGECVLTTSTKWTSDSNLLSPMNTACDPLGLLALVKLNDTRAHVIVAMCSHAFIGGD